MRKRISGLAFVMATIAVNSTWAQGPGIVDPVRSVSAKVYACTLNAGKTMADVNAVQPIWISAAEEGEHNGFTVKLTPRYGNVPYDVIWIDYLPIDQLAQSSEWWDDNAQEFNAAISEVVSCHTTLNNNRLDYLNEALPEDGDGTGFFFWNWCTPREGVTGAAVAACEAGTTATIEMQSRVSRAGWMGERSIGVQDPGATAVLFMLQAAQSWVNANSEPQANGGP